MPPLQWPGTDRRAYLLPSVVDDTHDGVEQQTANILSILRNETAIERRRLLLVPGVVGVPVGPYSHSHPDRQESILRFPSARSWEAVAAFASAGLSENRRAFG